MISVEDEWERELEATEDLDVLFIKYDTGKITIEQILTAIQENGFAARVEI